MTLDVNLRELARLALEGWSTTPASDSKKGKAHELLRDPDAPALALLLAAKMRLGEDFLKFEPETLWHELGDLPQGNRDRLLAGIAVLTTPSFFWDYRVFGHTSAALAGEPVFPEEVPHPSVIAMAWGAFEARLTFALDDEYDPEYDDEIEAFVASVLATDGFVLAPEFLAFSQEKLDELLSTDGKALTAKVRDVWDRTPKASLDDHSFEDDALGVQLRRLADVQLGLAQLAKHCTESLRRLLR